MGGGVSSVLYHHRLSKTEQIMVPLMMPSYFDPIDCLELEHQIAEQSWNLVLSDTSPEFLVKKDAPEFLGLSCVHLFQDYFYSRLFDIHPGCKDLFKAGMNEQRMFLVLMLSLSLSQYTNPAEFDKSLVKLTEMYYRKGVKALEYGVVGDALFWALRKVLGDAYYTPDLHCIWIKIYSRMLKTIIPVAVSCELKGNEAVKMHQGPSFTTPRNDANVLHGSRNNVKLVNLADQKIINARKASDSSNRPH